VLIGYSNKACFFGFGGYNSTSSISSMYRGEKGPIEGNIGTLADPVRQKQKKA
jgi:hypothetical protein